jgi:uncharacterized membrane-anchored protein YhcB (DUF1043 family)
MTFEEMEKILEGMFAVQRDLQEGQLRLQERQEQLQESQERQRVVLDELIQQYGNLFEHSERQQKILDQLIGYSLTNESEHLSLEEQLQALDARRKRLENPR